MRLQRHWYLGFLGLIGFYSLPIMIAVYQGTEPWWKLSGALWFLWFLSFVPKFAKEKSGD